MPKTKSDLDQLQGTWRVAALETDGVKMKRAVFADAAIVVKGQTFVSKGMGAPYEGTLTLNESTKPKSFDLVFTVGTPKGKRNLGIYKLDKNRWVICLATRGSERPARFATKADSGIALETLTRAAVDKQKEKTETPTPKSPKPATKSSKPSLPEPAGPSSFIDGEWAMVSAIFDGKPMDAGMVAWCTRISSGGVTTIMAGPQTMLKARFTVKDGARPAPIDYVTLEGAHKNKAQTGICDLTDGILRICMSPPDRPRPDVFVSKAGDGRSFTTWRRKTSK